MSRTVQFWACAGVESAVINSSFTNANVPHDQAWANLCCRRQRKHVTVSRGLATEKLHRGGWPAAGGPAQELKGPAQELKGPANAAPFCSSPHTVLVSRLPAPPLHRHHNYQNFSFSQFPTIIIKISSPMVPTTSALALAPPRLGTPTLY
jgi:hypothetical protein